MLLKRGKMHTYLESVGFSSIKGRREMDRLAGDTVLHFYEKNIFEDENGRLMGEFSREYAPGMGMTVCGEFDEGGDFHPEYSFPFFRGAAISSEEESDLEKHAGKESFAGACDDPRVGVTIIFYLINMGEYLSKPANGGENRKYGPVKFSALAKEGEILLPVRKDLSREKERGNNYQEHTRLVSEARFGNEEAIESLTMEDIDAYAMLTERVKNEDILSLVDTSFMPYGIECDQYSIIATIISCEKVRNIYSGEHIYQMEIEVCDITMDLCINADRLYGEPKVGRRFRGLVWLQGYICFSG